MWLAFQVDSVVHMWGTSLNNELESVEGKNKAEIRNKRERVLSKWLDLPQQFRSPSKAGTEVEQEFKVKGSQS